jgi:ubiquinone/menaquinone biosynthesis C-methylase UbiE
VANSEEVKARIRTNWIGAAEVWDKRHEELEQHSRSVNEWLCQAAGLKPGSRVLDLASGTGQPAFTAAGAVGAEGSVLATDIAPTMVEVINRRAQESGITNLEAREMDMDTLDLPDASFDAVTCRWGFMFSPEPVRALSEARRVLRDGGRLATATWDFGPANTWMLIAFRAIGTVNPRGGGGAPPSNLDSVETLSAALREAGFTDASAEQRSFPFEFASGEAWWDFLMDFGNAVISRFSPEEQARIRTAAVAEAETHRRGESIVLGASCICAVATK